MEADMQTKVDAINAEASCAIARLRAYEAELKAERDWAQWKNVSEALFRFAHGAALEDLTTRLAHMEAVDTLLLGIPNVIQRIEDDRRKALGKLNAAHRELPREPDTDDNVIRLRFAGRKHQKEAAHAEAG